MQIGLLILLTLQLVVCALAVTCPSYASDGYIYVSSVSYPSNYDSSSGCDIAIDGTPDTGRLVIEFLDFDVEDAQTDCDQDYLSFEGDGEEIVRFCAHNGDTSALYNFTTPTAAIDIVFEQDGDGNVGKGFLLRYNVTGEDTECGQTKVKYPNTNQFSNKVIDGFMVSPGYDGTNAREAGMDCEWVFELPDGYTVQLSSLDFDLPPPTADGCVDEYIEVSDDDHSTRFCGSIGPDALIGWSPDIDITYSAPVDPSTNYRGFNIKWIIVPERADEMETGGSRYECGDEISLAYNDLGSVTTIESIGFGQYPYIVDSSCSWKVVGDDKAACYFISFDVGSDDFLYVYDGEDNSGAFIGAYTGSTLPASAFSTSSALFFQFVTGSVHGAELGFQIQCVNDYAGGGACLPGSNPCIDPGYCLDDGTSATCISDCSAEFCGNGSCLGLEGNATCDCSGTGRAPPFCLGVDDCDSAPCANGGTCADAGLDAFICTCLTGWTGPTCTVSEDNCASDPCQNLGVCNSTGADSFTCNCTNTGYTGDICETPIDECASNPCDNGGICIDGVLSFTCDCSATGYSGVTCTDDVDDCLSDPCQNLGVCSDTGLDSFACNCDNTGYTGDICETPVEECASNPCDNGGICTDGVGVFTCNCTGTGYSGVTCTDDVDDCLSYPCQNAGSCSDAGPDAFACNCDNTGYAGDICETPIDECASNPCDNGGICTDGFLSFTCNCTATGYSGVTCSDDVDDCLSYPCQNFGICSDAGVNMFTCNCAGTDHYGDVCESPFDDCASNPCANGGICTDGVGVFTCDCTDTGYMGSTCIDDVDDCMSYPCEHGGTCSDMGTDAFECDCTDTGFNGTTCEIDLDDCLSSPCANNGICADIGRHQFECNCTDTGFTGFTCKIMLDDACSSSPCGEGMCNNVAGEYEYTCDCAGSGFNGTNCQDDVDDCLSSPCLNGGICNDTGANSIECNCTGTGFNGTLCEVDVERPYFASCPGTDKIHVVAAASSTGAVVYWNANNVSAVDTVDATPVVLCTHSSGDLFPLGNSTVICQATDASGNVAVEACSFNIQVVDAAPPVLYNCPESDITQSVFEADTAVVYWTTIFAVDVESVSPVISSSHESGQSFPLGSTPVSIAATDDSGNTAVCEFTVHIHTVHALYCSVFGTEASFDDAALQTWMSALEQALQLPGNADHVADSSVSDGGLAIVTIETVITSDNASQWESIQQQVGSTTFVTDLELLVPETVRVCQFDTPFEYVNAVTDGASNDGEAVVVINLCDSSPCEDDNAVCDSDGVSFWCSVTPLPEYPTSRVSLDPSYAVNTGGSVLVLKGLRLRHVINVFINDMPIEFSIVDPEGDTDNATSIAQRRLLTETIDEYVPYQADEVEDEIYFLAPAFENTTEYLRLSFVLDPLQIDLIEVFTFETMLYYVNDDACIKEGFYAQDEGGCVRCSTGGVCPGGGRIWPLPGYWSESEFSAPVECSSYAACPGSDDLQTTVCTDGYIGFACTRCDEEGYFRDGSTCRSCGASDADKADVFLRLMCALFIFFGFIICMAFMPTRHLVRLAEAVITLQQLAVLTTTSSQELPDSTSNVTSILGLLNFLNFDMDTVKPGCSIPMISYSTVFWMSFVLAFVIFASGVIISWIYHSYKNRSAHEWDVKLKVSCIAFCDLVYLRLTYLCFTSVLCTDSGSGSRLTIDKEMLCYADDHLAMAALSWFTIVFFSLFYPVFVYTILKKASTYSTRKNKDGTPYVATATDPITEADLVENPTLYKIRNFRRSTFSAAIAPLFISFVIAFLNVMPISASVQTLLAGIFVGAELAYVLIRMPYWHMKPLTFKVVKNTFYLLFTLLFMVLLSEESTRGSDIAPVLVFSGILLLLVGLFFYGYAKLKRNSALLSLTKPLPDTHDMEFSAEESYEVGETDMLSLSPQAATYSIQKIMGRNLEMDLLTDVKTNSMDDVKDEQNGDGLHIHHLPGAPRSQSSISEADSESVNAGTVLAHMRSPISLTHPSHNLKLLPPITSPMKKRRQLPSSKHRDSSSMSSSGPHDIV